MYIKHLQLVSLLLLLPWLPVSCQSDPSPNSISNHQQSDSTFFNPYAEKEDVGFSKIMKWFWNREKPEISDSLREVTVPHSAPDYNALLHPIDSVLQVTWIGHSTFLVQLNGLNMLTDPIFSDRCSPVQWAGPKRITPPAIPYDSLPPIDIVLISHNHYDHLDRETVERIGNAARWFVPLKVKPWFSDEGITTAMEMDWWDATTVGPLRIICTPAQHFSGRTPTGRNESLWSSWTVIGPHHRFWFAGDTGYNTVQFKEIGKKYGPFDLGFIPIGAYDPPWIMKNHHVNPEEAVLIHKDIRSRFSIDMHWGTFILTDEPIGEPPERLKVAVHQANLPDRPFITIPQGKTLSLQ